MLRGCPNNLVLPWLNPGAFLLHYRSRLLGVKVMIKICLEAIDSALCLSYLCLKLFEAVLLRQVIGQKLN
jgi:hypothetical protein